MQTVREITGKAFYSQKIIVISWREFDSATKADGEPIDNILTRAIWAGENCELRSAELGPVCSKYVDSFGAFENYLIICTH